jgi:hypothetical protein
MTGVSLYPNCVRGKSAPGGETARTAHRGRPSRVAQCRVVQLVQVVVTVQVPTLGCVVYSDASKHKQGLATSIARYINKHCHADLCILIIHGINLGIAVIMKGSILFTSKHRQLEDPPCGR